MVDPMNEHLEREMRCEGVMECFYGLTDLDQQIYLVLADSDEPLTVDEVAEAVDRERSTAYRGVRRLVDAGFVRREQVNYDDGGYYHVFTPVDADEMADQLQRLLNDWYAQMGQLIDEFRQKYRDAPAPLAVD